MAPEQSAMGLPVREFDHLACVADEPALIQAAVDHLGPPLRAGRPAVALATGEHLARIEEQLADAGVDLPASAFARWNADVVRWRRRQTSQARTDRGWSRHSGSSSRG